MKQSPAQLWERFQQFQTEFPTLGLTLDLSRTAIERSAIEELQPRIYQAFLDMAALEAGSLANPDEKRRVGHYWLRHSELAPEENIKIEINNIRDTIQAFAAQVHSGTIAAPGGSFTHLLLIGIGGSALGPQFIYQALGSASDRLQISFLDNTDPDGMDKVLSHLQPVLNRTLVLVISKSGGTKETRNGMLETKAVFERSGLDFSKQTVAITGYGSELDQVAKRDGWLARFPMWDWVGGRTSVTSAVGLLPMALQGVDIEAFIQGACETDAVTRTPNYDANPAMQLAVAWYIIGEGRGAKDMVVLPYKDRLELFSKYLQQLIMESIGKELDLSGNRVNQGIAVYGNKGATDQHAYIQQLRDGLNNFFVTFIEVLRDRQGESIEVEPGVTSGDYLQGFFLGTREALYENDRQSITLTIPEVSAYTVGLLIALYERAVGFYAQLVHINAYHQPGVEAGKKAAGAILEVHHKVMAFLQSHAGHDYTADEIASAIQLPARAETIFKLCERWAFSGKVGKISSSHPAECRYHRPLVLNEAR